MDCRIERNRPMFMDSVCPGIMVSGDVHEFDEVVPFGHEEEPVEHALPRGVERVVLVRLFVVHSQKLSLCRRLSKVGPSRVLFRQSKVAATVQP